MAMRFKELDRILKENGWEFVRAEGSHHTYKHPAFKEIVTITRHPGDLNKRLVQDVLKTAKIKS
jgi:predicted RNA binding protein YcfA (HicA-like mRNA interferase family)